jgi:molecular chaperone GrpE
MSKKQKHETAADPTEPTGTSNPAPTPTDPAPVPVPDDEEPLKLQMLRLQADFDNFRKRTQRERAELFLMANETLFLEMLPVIDHFEMGFKSAESHQTDCSVTDGFRLVYNQLFDVLKKFNVTPVEAVGAPFDPHRHEALLHMPSDQPAETVIEQVRRGWLLGDKLLRAAQVIVSSGRQEENQPSE